MTLVVSKGAEPPRQVRVPLLVGRSAAEATAALAAVGLDAEVENAFPFGARSPDDGRSSTRATAPAAWWTAGRRSCCAPSDLATRPAAAQPRSISATRNASSSDCWVFSRGSQAVS